MGNSGFSLFLCVKLHWSDRRTTHRLMGCSFFGFLDVFVGCLFVKLVGFSLFYGDCVLGAFSKAGSKSVAVCVFDESGFAVNDFLTQYFPDIIDVGFTAKMENELDDIAGNERVWASVVQDFYAPFDKDLQKALQVAEKVKLEDEKTGEMCPKCGKPLVVKTGRFGKFIACSGYPECRHTQSFQVKVGVNCPECGKALVQRVSKKKRTFYGCSGYPDCGYTESV